MAVVFRALFVTLCCLLITASGVAILAGAPEEPEAAPPAEPEPLPGQREVLALVEAYPGRIDAAEIRDGEWALLMDGQWYHWASGRLLPSELRDEWETFVPVRFYNYRVGVHESPSISPEMETALRERTETRTDGETDGRTRFNGFLDTLYQVSSLSEAERTMRPVQFLGRRTRVHPLIVEPLERVEVRIRDAMAADPVVAEFVSSLAAVHGYNWRSIAGTAQRSYHSYGVAVDLTPRSYRGAWPYWLWAAEAGVTEWWRIPLEDRWQVAQPVIDAFEAEGFIWGGKWLFFDNLHFEYRPEAIIMARDRAISPQ